MNGPSNVGGFRQKFHRRRGSARTPEILILIIIFRVRAPRRPNFCQKPPSFGCPSMPRHQQLDPSGLHVVILKGEVVFRCYDLPLLYS